MCTNIIGDGVNTRGLIALFITHTQSYTQQATCTKDTHNKQGQWFLTGMLNMV